MDMFRAFYQQYKDKLFAFLMRMTGDYALSDDVLQETFTRYLEQYGRQNHSPPLLYTIARNLVFDYSRKKKNDSLSLDENSEASYDQEHMFIVRDEYRRLLSAFQKLEEEERTILSLVTGGNLSYKEIASVTGLSEANIKVKVHRSRLKLKKILQEGEI